MRNLLRCLLIVVTLSSPTLAWSQTPPVFREIGEPAELERVLADNGRVLVSFSVPWCMGCLRMDENVWRDPSVVREAETLGACLRPKEEFLAAYRARFDVEGFPELILFEEGEEVGRLRGFWEPERVLAWLDDPASKTDPGDPRLLPIGEVHDRAIDLLLEERWGEAAAFMSVFWVRSAHADDMTDTLRWLRWSRYPSMLRRVAQSDAGREEIEQLRRSLPTEGPSVDADERLVHDWLVLSLALGEIENIDAWTDRMLTLADGPATLSVHEQVFDRLLERGLVEEAGQILSPAIWGRWVARAQGIEVGHPVHDGAPARVIEKEQRDAPERLRRFMNALRAAGRDAQAEELESALSGG